MSDEGEASGPRGGRPDRRDLLQQLGGLGAVSGLAGCSLTSGDGTDTAATDADGTGTDESDGDGTDAEGGEPTETEAEPVDPVELETEYAILVLSATAGYRHDAIEAGNQAIRELSEDIAADVDAESVSVDVVDDPNGDAGAFPSTAEELAAYDVVVWNNTTGDVLDDDQQAAFRRYVKSGGGYAGIHAAADTEYDWDWYGDLVGAYFEDHPEVQTAEVTVTDRAHPSTAHLPTVWEAEDEWYDYATNPRGDVHVLATLDEDSYEGASMRNGRSDHPIAWCHESEGGRAWYTGRGHAEANYRDEDFREHLRKGIMWAAGYVDGDASGTVWESYTRTTLDTGLDHPLAIDVAPDGRVFYIQRRGTMYVIEDGSTSTAGILSVYDGDEDGLVGMRLDPDFESNGWVYLYYAPPENEVGDAPYNQLSRFTIEDNEIDTDSEVEIFRVETQRETCCHTGGEIDFDAEGNLYLTTGDDTNPFESEGYAPIDERDGREFYDAQRTSANTADLRGKVLRITPEDDGSYTVPDDNLFTEAQGYGEEIEDGLVRPEIYAMGCRNPYTAAVDPETGWFYFGDYGPDAETWSEERGPPGIVEFNQVREAGNYGWPLVVGPNIPFRRWDFDAESGGEPFDPENPVNDSPNNTGLEELPPCEESMLFYPKSWSSYGNAADYVDLKHEKNPHPELPAGGAPTAGPVFRHDEEAFSETALPASFDGKHFIAEWGENWLKYVTFDDDGEVVEIDPFLPTELFQAPIDMEVGPDGALYLLEFGGWEGTSGTRISRIENEG